MWLAVVIPCLVLAVPSVAAPAQAPKAPVQRMAEPILTRYTTFSIPYKLQPRTDSTLPPVEAQLYVSTDHGAHWQLYSKIPPTQKQFRFRSAGDGEYWYAIRAMNKAGQVWPKWTNVPDLRVIVDTAPPKFDLKSWRGDGGQVTAQWEISDPHLRSTPIELQFRTSPTQPWQPIALGVNNYHTAGSIQTGEVTWWPGKTSGLLQVRAEAADAAGNIAVNLAQVDLSVATAAVAKPVVSLMEWTAEHKTATTAPTTAEAAKPPVAEAKDNQAVPAHDVALTMPNPQTGVPDTQAGAPLLIAPTGNPAPASVPMGINPPLQSEYKPAAGNTRVFEIEYDATSPIELWETRNNGQTWQRHSLAEGNQQPLRVKVDEAGVYGFRLVVRNGAGTGDEPPQLSERLAPGIRPDQTQGTH